MYYYKQAIKLNDTKAAEKYLLDYAFYGGTNKTKQQSFDGMNPENGLKKSELSDFKKWLTPEETKTYETAMSYYKELVSSERDNKIPLK
jgi:TPR repeat protein